MKFKSCRTLILVAVLVVFAFCYGIGVATGTWCGYGISDIAALCPVGALLTMIASKTLIPQAVVSIVFAIVFFLILGRMFCGWFCPVTLWRRINAFFMPNKKRLSEEEATSKKNQTLAAYAIECAKTEQAVPASSSSSCSACSICNSKMNKPFDSRHAVLGGAALTTLIFGFPVFCLVCPVGLSFALIALVISLFGAGTLNWSLAFVPILLIVELLFLRKWCSRICPISAFMSLFSRFSRTGMPIIDNNKCLETTSGTPCSKCATVCTFDVNLRHPNFGELPLHDCARCGDCIDVCPAKAISFKARSH